MTDIFETEKGNFLLRFYKDGKVDHYLRFGKHPTRKGAEYREYWKDTPEWQLGKFVKSDVHGVSDGYKREGEYLCEGTFTDCLNCMMAYGIVWIRERRNATLGG